MAPAFFSDERSMPPMTTTNFIVTKSLTALAGFCLMVVGIFFVYAASRAINDTTQTVNPEVSLLLVPGIAVLILSLAPTLSLLLLKRKHSGYLHYLSAAVCTIGTLYLLNIFFL
jgi:hypothetical protein